MGEKRPWVTVCHSAQQTCGEAIYIIHMYAYMPSLKLHVFDSHDVSGYIYVMSTKEMSAECRSRNSRLQQSAEYSLNPVDTNCLAFNFTLAVK